jgi:hypothetical protein
MDILSDNLHAMLYHVCKSGNAPEFVKNAEAMTKEAADKLPDSLFADRTNRRYPIDSKANTWLSAAYFVKSASNDGYGTEVLKNYVGEVIKLAASRYGIRKEVDALFEKKPEPIEKKASDDDSNYGWPAERKYPMFDEHGVKLAQDYFAENAFKYPADMRRTIAKNILRKCSEYGFSPNDTVRTEAGEGFQMQEFTAAHLLDRVKAAGNSGHLKEAEALAKGMKALFSQNPKNYAETMEKFASIVETFDHMLGFDRKYGTRFLSPAALFHGRSIKEAQAIKEDTVVLKDHAFSITKLAELPIEVFTDALGDDFGERVKSASGIDRDRLADELHSMPLPDRNALYRSIRDFAS